MLPRPRADASSSTAPAGTATHGDDNGPRAAGLSDRHLPLRRRHPLRHGVRSACCRRFAEAGSSSTSTTSRASPAGATPRAAWRSATLRLPPTARPTRTRLPLQCRNPERKSPIAARLPAQPRELPGATRAPPSLATGFFVVARSLLLNIFIWIFARRHVAFAAPNAVLPRGSTAALAAGPGRQLSDIPQQCAGNALFDALLAAAVLLAVVVAAAYARRSRLSSWRLQTNPSRVAPQRLGPAPLGHGSSRLGARRGLVASLILAHHALVPRSEQWGALLFHDAPLIWLLVLTLLVLASLQVSRARNRPGLVPGAEVAFAQVRAAPLAGEALRGGPDRDRCLARGRFASCSSATCSPTCRCLEHLARRPTVAGRCPTVVYLVALGSPPSSALTARTCTGRSGSASLFLIVAGSAFLSLAPRWCSPTKSRSPRRSDVFRQPAQGGVFTSADHPPPSASPPIVAFSLCVLRQHQRHLARPLLPRPADGSLHARPECVDATRSARGRGRPFRLTEIIARAATAADAPDGRRSSVASSISEPARAAAS